MRVTRLIEVSAGTRPGWFQPCLLSLWIQQVYILQVVVFDAISGLSLTLPER